MAIFQAQIFNSPLCTAHVYCVCFFTFKPSLPSRTVTRYNVIIITGENIMRGRQIRCRIIWFFSCEIYGYEKISIRYTPAFVFLLREREREKKKNVWETSTRSLDMYERA